MTHTLTLTEIERAARMRARSARAEIAYFERRLHLAHRWQSPDARKRLAVQMQAERDNLHSALQDIAAIRAAMAL